MPTFKFEAMDAKGGEVSDAVDALSEEEAQQKIKQMGYFATKITEVAAKRKGKGKGKPAGGKRARSSLSVACRRSSCARSRVSYRPCKTPACRSCAACASSNTR